MLFLAVSLNLCYNLHAELSFLAVSFNLCYNLSCRVVVPCILSQSLLQSPMQSCHSLQSLSISATISHVELSFLAVSLNLCLCLKSSPIIVDHVKIFGRKFNKTTKDNQKDLLSSVLVLLSSGLNHGTLLYIVRT